MSEKQKKTTKSTAKGIKKSWGRWLLITSAKLLFSLVFALAIFTIYLDAKVQTVFEGQRWQIPAQIYGKIIQLKKGDNIDVSHITQSLQLNGYKKVRFITSQGQYAQSTSRLIIFRRAFDFPQLDQNSVENSTATQLTIDIKNSKISQLYIENTPVEQVQLEPILLARIVPDNKEDRVVMALENMPTMLLDTLLLVEDREFYHHQGISPLGILRALYNNILAGHTVQGGSTLTQQLVKNMFLTRDRTLTRKMKEAIMALIIEVRYSKDQLLEAYINEVYLGQHYANGIYGFGLAAKFYFGKTIAELTIEQIALLVAQVKGPSYYDPWRHPERAKQRRDLILRLMFEQRLFSVNDFEQAMESPLSIRENKRFKKDKYPAYLRLVKQELNHHLTSKQQKMGIRVFTGFSHVSQQLLEQTVSRQLTQLEQKYQQTNLQAAMVVTDIASAEIRALVGDRQSGYAGFNRAINAKRPVGSLIKPSIYLAALERYEQYNFATVLADKPITLGSGQRKQWRPKNYDGKYRNQVPLIDGLVHSLNIPTVNLGMALGLENVANAIHLLGYPHDIVTRPSILLGAINMSPLEINQMYLPIANQGMGEKVHTVNAIVSSKASSSGEVLWQFQSSNNQVISTKAAYLMDFALTKVTQKGTARSLTWRMKNINLAGKTGTSNEARDSWFIGYDAKHLVTTWVGKDNNKPTKLTGSSGALVLFSDFMKNQGSVSKLSFSDKGLSGKRLGERSLMPEGVQMTLFEKKTGHAVTNKCANTIKYPAIIDGIEIQQACLKELEVERSWYEKLFGD